MRSGRGLTAIGLLAGGLMAALSPLVLLGIFVRPASDDWCLVPMARSGGFNAIVADVYGKENGRLGNAAVLGLIFTTYDISSKILPGIVLVLLLLAFFGIWRALLRYAFGTDEVVASVSAAGLAAGTVLALLLGKPHRYQTLYHAPTIVSHTMPLMIAGVILLVVLAFHHRGRIWPAAAAALVGGAFLGTFNEAFTGVALVSVVAGLALCWLLPRHAIHWTVVAAGGVGVLLGFVSVFVSPGSRNRQQLIHGGSLFSPHLVHQTYNAWARVVGTALTSGEGLLLLLVSAAVGVWLGLGVRRMGRRHGRRFYVAALLLPALWGLSASFGATFVLAYSFNGSLVGRERAWPSITVAVLLASSWYAVLLGQFVARKVASADVIPRHRRIAVVGALVALPALALLAVGGVVLVRDERALTEVMVVRSVAWDQQQNVIHRQIARGAKALVLTPLPIDGLYEPFYPNPRAAWPASCAPDFYGVDRVVRPKKAAK